jgi:hypothetical protein
MRRQNNAIVLGAILERAGVLGPFFFGANRGEMHGTWEQIVVI